MAECAYCKTQTELYENGTPVCLECAGAQAGDSPSSAESQIRLMLLQEVRQATDRVTAAAQRFNLTSMMSPAMCPIRMAHSVLRRPRATCLARARK